jgi:hypothetical protein
MRILKILFIGIAGAALVTWSFVAFIAKDHVVRIQQSAGALRYSVDDGTEFTNVNACVTHCLNRRAWNLQNTVRICARESVSTNEVQYLADLMCYNHIYPTTLDFETASGKHIQQYQPGPYIETFGRQEQLNANHTSEGIRQPADGLPKPSM